MKQSRTLALVLISSLGLGIATATAHAHPGQMDDGTRPHAMGGMQHGMMGGMGHGAQGGLPHGGMGGGAAGASAGGHGPMMGAVGMLTRQDAGSAADMGLVHDLVMNHARIRRTVTNLPDGIRTVTESDDPQAAQTIKAHVASMSKRLKDGREFNIFSTTLPVLFEHREKIKSVVEMTEKGSVVTRTSTDARVVAALQGHAAEVTELVQEGPIAMRRGMMSRMAMGFRGPPTAEGSEASPDAPK